MQTIKCVVVGDGAVGKVSRYRFFQILIRSLTVRFCWVDLSVDFIHDKQISQRICPNRTLAIYTPMRLQQDPFLRRFLITMR